MSETGTETAGEDYGFADDDETYYNDEDTIEAEYSKFADTENTPAWQPIFDAPDFSTLLKRPKTKVSREYEERAQSALKSLTLWLVNAGDLRDAATVLKYGKSIATATGDLADSKESVRHIIDYASTPASPLLQFIAVTMPALTQFFVNHEEQIKAIPEARRRNKDQKRELAPRVKLHFLGRAITLPVRRKFNPVKLVLSSFRVQAVRPNELVVEVFQDEKLIAALNRHGIPIKGVKWADPNDEK